MSSDCGAPAANSRTAAGTQLAQRSAQATTTQVAGARRRADWRMGASRCRLGRRRSVLPAGAVGSRRPHPNDWDGGGPEPRAGPSFEHTLLLAQVHQAAKARAIGWRLQ